MIHSAKSAFIMCASLMVLTACDGGSSSVTPFTTPPTGGGGPTGNPVVLSDLVYGRGATDDGDIDLLLDIHQPSNVCEANRPTIFFVHGGGFIRGNKSGGSHPARAAAAHAKGFNYVSIMYRLVPDSPVLGTGFQTLYDDFLANNTDPNVDLDQVEATFAAYEDALAALNWLEANADDNCLDMTRLAYWGSSAGAFTVLNVAYSSDDLGFSRPDPDVVINYWGQLPRIPDMAFMEAPFFTVHGDQDGTVDYQASLDLAAQADAVGVPYTFYTEVGGLHGVETDKVVNGVTLMDLTLNFIEAHIVGGTPLYETANVD